MLLLDPGLGKTSITYAALKVLKNKGAFKGALVLAPLRPAYSVWPKEQEKWEDFSGFSVGVLHGKNKEQVLTEQHDIYVLNFEGIDWLFNDKDALKLLFSKVDTLVIDELSKFKHTNTKRFKLVKPFLCKFQRRWGLTGSPASNGLMDLFGQCYVLDLGKALGHYITHYRNKFFYSTGFGGYTWALKIGAEKDIYKAIKPLALRMDADDYIDMPQVIPVPIYVDLPPAARKLYDTMEEELFAIMDDNTELVAVNAASASTKCEQIANGAIYEDRIDPLTGIPVRGKRAWKEIHNAKLEALSELIDELQGNPTLFAYHFGHDLERIVKTLGKNTPHMDVSAKKGDALMAAWNRNELPYLFGHPASIGHGNNLQEGQAHHMGFFHIPWDFELYDQFVRRLRRQGNKAKTLFIYHFVARDTVDEAKMRALNNKFKGQKDFLDALKTYRKSKA